MSACRRAGAGWWCWRRLCSRGGHAPLSAAAGYTSTTTPVPLRSTGWPAAASRASSPRSELAPPVLPGDIGRGDESAGLVLRDELDEPPRPAERAVDPRLVRRRDLLHQHKIVGADAECLDLRAAGRPQGLRDRGVRRLGCQIHPNREHLPTLRRPAITLPRAPEDFPLDPRRDGGSALRATA